MTNILEAIFNIVAANTLDVHNSYAGKNRINNVGEGLETYIKDAFANTILEKNAQNKLKKHTQIFSWLGTQNNPPDIMIKNGDAIEVKKISGNANSIPLNSSYPKDKIYSNNHMVTEECRNCEDWHTKDLIYCIGHVPNKTQKLKSLWMVYGGVYSANKNIYERIKNAISEGVVHISDIKFSHTKELGRVNEVDPLGITNLRIRRLS